MKGFLIGLTLACLPLNLYADIQVYAHRGARARRPENTLAAFEYALSQHVDVLELDLGVSKDNHLVIAHDPLINAELCRDAKGNKITEKLPLRSLLLKDIQTFDCGSLKNPRFPEQVLDPGAKIPTLEELFQLVKKSRHPTAKQVLFNMEIKVVPRFEGIAMPTSKEFARLIAELVAKYQLESRVIVQSFDARALVHMKNINPKIKRAQIISENYFESATLFKNAVAHIFSPQLNWVTQDFVREARTAGLQVVPWTANTREEWQWLMSLGVDGIITDDPAALKLFLQENSAKK